MERVISPGILLLEMLKENTTIAGIEVPKYNPSGMWASAIVKEAGMNDVGIVPGTKVLVPRGKLRLVDEVNGTTYSIEVNFVAAVIEE